jgi:hypothetical protein
VVILKQQNGTFTSVGSINKPTEHTYARDIYIPWDTTGYAISLGTYTFRFQHGNRIIASGTVTLQ